MGRNAPSPGTTAHAARNGHTPQTWYCNIYTNTLFTKQINPAAFDPIRREFSRSRSPLSRPAQQLYVTAATHPSTAAWFAQHALTVSPPAPEGPASLIVAGNHKIRILRHDRGQSVGILKHGFSREYLQNELNARQKAAGLGILVPTIREVSAEQNWFREDYISGTPLNRLRDEAQVTRAFQAAAGHLQRLAQATLQEERCADYIEKLACRANALVTGSHLLSAAQKGTFAKVLSALLGELDRRKAAYGASMSTVLAHGDFQAANILLNDAGPWLTDWEYSARRQAGYDLLVYRLNARHPKNLARRLQAFVTDESRQDAFDPPGLRWQSRADRAFSALLFLLEEWVLHLEENSNPLFFQIGEGLELLAQETTRWLAGQGVTLG